MNYFKNPYYSSENKDFVSIENLEPTPERMARIKANNKFIITLLSQIYQSKTPADLKNTHTYRNNISTILSGELPNADNVTGFNSKKLGEKLKFLVLAFCDSSHPENINKIRFSAFMKEIMFPLFLGDFNTEKAEDKWTLYQNYGNDEKLKKFTSLNGALKCYIEDPKTPVGMNFVALIDSFIIEKNGTFEFADINDIKMKEDMVLATKEFISLLKSNKRFKENYKNPNVIEAEFEDA